MCECCNANLWFIVSCCFSIHFPVIYSVMLLSYFPAKILYNSIISPLILLYFRVGNFSSRNLSSWCNFLTFITRTRPLRLIRYVLTSPVHNIYWLFFGTERPLRHSVVVLSMLLFVQSNGEAVSVFVFDIKSSSETVVSFCLCWDHV